MYQLAPPPAKEKINSYSTNRMNNSHFLIGIVFSITLILGNLKAQNLVPNPGFETGSCPNYINLQSGGVYPADWFEFPRASAYKTTSDYFKIGCFDGSTFGAGDEVGEAPPHFGDAWMGIFCYTTQNTCPYGTAEGTMAKLNTSLVPGSSYVVSFWLKEFVNSVYNNNIKNPSEGIGIWLWGANSPAVDYCPTGPRGMEVSASSPPQYLAQSDSITSTWTNFSFIYTPTTSIDSIGIAGWFPLDLLDAYYNLDDVSVTLLPPCGACTLSGSGAVLTWTGCLSTDWFDPCNWDQQSVPTITSTVIIPNTINHPLINSGTANCYEITIHDNVDVTVVSSNGASINIVNP